MGQNNEWYYFLSHRIVIAEMQNIVYGQYLPEVLGQGTMDLLNLGIEEPTHYSAEVDPSITNAFATAAYRFGHSSIQSIVKLKNVFDGAETSYR